MLSYKINIIGWVYKLFWQLLVLNKWTPFWAFHSLEAQSTQSLFGWITKNNNNNTTHQKHPFESLVLPFSFFPYLLSTQNAE